MPVAERIDPFAAAEEPLDLTGFKPEAKGTRPKPDKAATKAVAAQLGFTSREPPASIPNAAEPDPAPRGRVPRRATEQRQQFNLRAYPSVIERFSALADAQHWQLAVAFEQAVAALEEKLAKAS